MKAAEFLIAAGSGLVALLLAGCAPEKPRMPNVLLVTLDTTRADRLGAYGHPDDLTPGMDALAREGARFAFAISTAGLTPMAHASILTGLNNYAHGLRVFGGELGHRLPDEVPSLPEILARRGYDTAAFVSAYPVSQVYGLDRGFARYETGLDIDLDAPRRRGHDTSWADQRRASGQRRSDDTTDDALAWLERSERDRDRPWMAWVHYFDVHDVSLVPPREYAVSQGVAYDPSIPPTDIRMRDQMYDFELRWLDLQLQRLFARLRELGEWENTVVVLTSDHGQGLVDGMQRHGWPMHRLLYQWSLHVPLILRGPGVPAGVEVDELVRTIDILPTLLELLDLPAPEIEGESLLPLTRGVAGRPRIAYADALNTFDEHAPLRTLPPSQQDDLYMVMDQRWKLIHHRLHPEQSELYDLAEDPEELQNLYALHPDQVRRLRAFLEERDALRLVPSGGGSAPDRSTLEALGYTGDHRD